MSKTNQKCHQYEYRETKHILNSMLKSVVFIIEYGINSVKQIYEYIKKSAKERQNLQDKIKEIKKNIQLLFDTKKEYPNARVFFYKSTMYKLIKHERTMEFT